MEPAPPPGGRDMRDRRRVPAEIRNVSFPIAVRGYERRAVDRYIARVNRLIAELEATSSPEAAIRHALSEIEDQTRGMLQAARDTAEEIVAAAQQEAAARTARAKTEAADIVVNASTTADRAKAEADRHVAQATAEAERILADSHNEAEERLQRSLEEVAAVREQAAAVREQAESWARDFTADTDAVREERRELVEDVRELAARLTTAAGNAGRDGETSETDPFIEASRELVAPPDRSAS
jgi:DivIVA domain-containing protein